MGYGRKGRHEETIRQWKILKLLLKGAISSGGILHWLAEKGIIVCRRTVIRDITVISLEWPVVQDGERGSTVYYINKQQFIRML